MLKHISIITQIVKIGNMGGSGLISLWGAGVDWFIDLGTYLLLNG